MKLRAGNLAIKEHALRGKRLLVFSKAKEPASVQFQWHFEYIRLEWIEAPDVDGNLRKAIRFILKKLNKIADTQPPNRGKRFFRKPSLTERTGLSYLPRRPRLLPPGSNHKIRAQMCSNWFRFSDRNPHRRPHCSVARCRRIGKARNRQRHTFEPTIRRAFRQHRHNF